MAKTVLKDKYILSSEFTIKIRTQKPEKHFIQEIRGNVHFGKIDEKWHSGTRAETNDLESRNTVKLTNTREVP